MRHLLLLLALVACAVEEEAELVPWAVFDPFARPSAYTVRPGDSLSKIADANGVLVEDLRAWNGIEGDLLEVDQVLLIWAPDRSRVPTAPAKGGSSPRRPVTIAVATVVVDVGPPPPRREMPRLVMNAGVLGAMDDTSEPGAMDPSLVDSIGDLDVHDDGGTGSGLESGHRADFAGGTAEEGPEIGRYTMQTRESGLTTAPVRAPRLATPAPKRCLAGPSGSDLDDYGMVTAKGLSERQIRSTLDAFVHHTSACVPAGSSGGLTVTTEITVGCDGRVSRVDIVGSGGAPAPVTACIAETLSKASFPAHDLPDGMSFVYPISYRF
jgi:hypothetical protein